MTTFYTNVMLKCKRCQTAYDPTRVSSRVLRLTYCGILCEVADLGYLVLEIQ